MFLCLLIFIILFLLFKYILLIMLLQLSHFFFPFSLLPCTPPPTNIPSPLRSCPWVVHVFGLSISYTILNLPLSILCLPIMLLIPCAFFLHSPPPLPTDNPPCDPHFCDSIPVLVVCLVFVIF